MNTAERKGMSDERRGRSEVNYLSSWKRRVERVYVRTIGVIPEFLQTWSMSRALWPTTIL
jgi:hypothetical protein